MKLVIAVAAATMLIASVAKAETVRILMETVPDTRYIQGAAAGIRGSVGHRR